MRTNKTPTPRGRGLPRCSGADLGNGPFHHAPKIDGRYLNFYNRIRALTARHPFKPTSPPLPTAWRLTRQTLHLSTRKKFRRPGPRHIIALWGTYPGNIVRARPQPSILLGFIFPPSPPPCREESTGRSRSRIECPAGRLHSSALTVVAHGADRLWCRAFSHGTVFVPLQPMYLVRNSNFLTSRRGSGIAIDAAPRVAAAACRLWVYCFGTTPSAASPYSASDRY
jgi:hypothetical protein